MDTIIEPLYINIVLLILFIVVGVSAGVYAIATTFFEKKEATSDDQQKESVVPWKIAVAFALVALMIGLLIILSKYADTQFVGILGFLVMIIYLLIFLASIIQLMTMDEPRELNAAERGSFAFLPFFVIFLPWQDIFSFVFTKIELLPAGIQDLVISIVYIFWFGFFISAITINILLVIKTISSAIAEKSAKKEKKTPLTKKLPIFSPANYVFWGNRIRGKISRRIIRYLLTPLLFIMDVIVELLYIIVCMLSAFLFIIVYALSLVAKYLGINYKKRFLDISSISIVKITIRITTIFTLIFVLISFQYNAILSKAGLSVYEFVASVILIPIIISQVISMRQKANKPETNISRENSTME